jgi:hypothetical protein
MITVRQQRLMRAGIQAEVRHYQRCMALLPHLPAEVLIAGLEYCDNEAGVAVWLCQPALSLGGKIPLKVAQSPAGAHKVAQILLAIADGGYV